MVEDWLLLRGLARQSGHWGAFIDELAVALPGARVHALDSPGLGSQRHRAAPLSLRATADDILARWAAYRQERSLPPDAKWGVLGISMGGMLAVEIASRAPPELRAAVVVNSSSNLSPAWRRLRPRAGLAMLRCLVTPRHGREAVMLPVSLNHADKHAAALKNWQALAVASPVPLRTFFAQLVACSRWRAPARVHVPVLVLAGKTDKLTAHACSVALAARLHALLHTHPTGGHDLTTDDPGWVAAQVRDWLDAGTPGLSSAGTKVQ